MKSFQRIEGSLPVLRGALFTFLVITMGIFANASEATVYDLVFGTAITRVEVPLNESRIMVFDEAIENVSVGNPAVADIVVLESRKLYVVGKTLGTTNIVVWGGGKSARKYSTLSVDVTHDLGAFKRHLHELFPNEKPEVRSAQGALVLSGEVSSATKVQAIAALAEQYVKNARRFSAAGGDGGAQATQDTGIINLMQVGGPQQVMLEVKIAEISRSVLKRLGINLAAYRPGRPWKVGAINGGAGFPNAVNDANHELPLFPNDQAWSNQNDALIGPMVQALQPTSPAISAAGLFASFLSGSSYFNLVVDASKEDGLAKILAEPTLTSLSGESAEFLSGGEFPVPMWSGEDNRVSVVFKEFGIAVKMLPVVLDSARINLSLNVSVSEMRNNADIAFAVPNSNVSYSIPSLSTRSASSTVELSDGQTIGIAGLISDKMRGSINKFPGLGDLPVLGALFRSQAYIQDQTELVMFVTAHLARPIDPDHIRLPTEAFAAPGDAAFYLFGRLSDSAAVKSGDAAAPALKPGVKRPTSVGGPTFGHAL